jgi:hypothetical protein
MHKKHAFHYYGAEKTAVGKLLRIDHPRALFHSNPSDYLMLKEPGKGAFEDDTPNEMGRWYTILHCSFFVTGKNDKIIFEHSIEIDTQSFPLVEVTDPREKKEVMAKVEAARKEK